MTTDSLSNVVINESFKKGLPLICLTNTNQDIKNVQYPVFYNNKNIESIFFITLLLTKIFATNSHY